MKRIFIICTLLFAGFTAVTAQQVEGNDSFRQRAGDPAEKEGKMIERLTKALELEDWQVSEIEAFRATNKVNRKAELETASTREEKREIHTKYAQLFNGQINTVLNEEQQSKYAEIKKKRKGAFKKRRARKASSQGEAKGF